MQSKNISINLSGQRITFVNKISLILKATADDESVTPGYLYKEINDISYESVGYSESLVEFLVDRLKNNSCHVKFKVLRLIKHLIENGSREFKLGIRRHSPAIQECTKFGGPPHPMHGNTPYVMVRKIATEVCESLYSMAPEAVRSPTDTAAPERPHEAKYGGLGPTRTGGSIQGFGNTPVNQSKSLGETILGGLEKLGAKMSETPSDRQAAVLAKLDLEGSTRNYQPPSLPPALDATASPDSMRGSSFLDSSAVSDKTDSARTRRPVKKPTPGKAGGGWGDDDDCEEDDESEDQSAHNTQSIKQSSIDTDSLGDPSGLTATDPVYDSDSDPQSNWSQESNLLTHTLATGSCGPGQALLAPIEVSTFVDEAAKLCCPRLVEMLAQSLTQADQGVVLRSLQLLEGVVYSREELMGVDALTCTCRDALVSCFLNSQSRSARSASQVDSPDASTPQGEELRGTPHSTVAGVTSVSNTVRLKSAKLILILQQLSSFKEILSADNFKSFLPLSIQCQTVSTNQR